MAFAPSRGVASRAPIGHFKDVRSLDVRDSDKLDETQLATWIAQAASIPAGTADPGATADPRSRMRT
jgi:hypothetical protein